MNIVHLCNINANTALLRSIMYWMCESDVIGEHMALCSPEKRFSGELL